MWDMNRIMGKVNVSDSGCWEWEGAFNTDGYPRMSERLPCGKYETNIKGHRKVFELIKGDIPEGYVVRHTCDNITCVNPDHLISGTPGDNVIDRRERGRTSFHISDSKRSKILELIDSGLTQSKVASKVGCSQTYVSKLLKGIYK
jgi:hypothetical protein